MEEAKNYDVVHLQNEFGLFCGPYELSFGFKVFYGIIKKLRKIGKRVFVTYHSEPSFLKALGWMNFENKKNAQAIVHTGKNYLNCIKKEME